MSTFPTLDGTESAGAIPLYTQALADVLDLPDPVELTAVATVNITATATGSQIPGLGVLNLTLDTPALVQVKLQSFIIHSGTSFSRIYYGYSGALSSVETALNRIFLVRGTHESGAEFTRDIILPAGTTTIAAYAYKGGAGQTFSTAYVNFSATPIRPVNP